jgi:hypothetical protein
MFVDITDRVLMEQENARLSAQNVYLQEEIKSVHNFEELCSTRSKKSGASPGPTRPCSSAGRPGPARS